MINSFRDLVVVSLLLFSCTTSRNVVSLKEKVNRITITSTNLSEDGSILSTKEDELLFLVFNYIDSQPLEQIVLRTFIFNEFNRSFSTAVDTAYSDTHKLVALIELDSSLSNDQISNRVKEHYISLLEIYKTHDLRMMEVILGDEDLLGIHIMDPKDRTINFDGTWRMDRYEYQINLVAHQ